MPVILDLFRGAVGALNFRLHFKNNYSNISIRKLDVLPIASAFLLAFLLATFSMFLLSLFYHFTQEEYQNHEHISTFSIFHVYVLETCVSWVVLLDFN